MGGLITYTVNVTWTGAGTAGTESYTSYARDHEVVVAGKPAIAGSSDPAFRGDDSRYSPEDLFVASLSQCHMLWVLHVAAMRGVRVTGYADRAVGQMRVQSAGGGQFTKVTLHPELTVADPVDEALIGEIHTDAHAYCFISRSVNFPVLISPVRTRVESA